MRVIIAGSRSVNDADEAIPAMQELVLRSEFNISEVVCGGARGADALGKKWADVNQIPVKMFPAEWGKFGKSAGYKRNKQMAEYADALIAIWDGESKGTGHMISLAEDYELEIFKYLIDK